MVTMFVRHRVRDYAEWKRIYDGIAPMRRNRGVVAASVYRDPNDPNTVIVLHRFRDLKSARRYADSVELKSVLAKAGIRGLPDIWIGEDVENTPY
jgi:quinol monooxygenase YgiN